MAEGDAPPWSSRLPRHPRATGGGECERRHWMDEARQLGSHGALRVGPRHGRRRDDGPSPLGTALAKEADPAPASGEGWVAELECGHNQHVRHNPPLITREWVTSPEGRAWGIAQRLDCRKCETGSMGFGTSNQRQRILDPSMLLSPRAKPTRRHTSAPV
jgi:hypothetical protein